MVNGFSVVIPMNEPLQTILEIDARHNELLDRLAELDAKILSVLDEWTNLKADTPGSQPLSATQESRAA